LFLYDEIKIFLIFLKKKSFYLFKKKKMQASNAPGSALDGAITQVSTKEDVYYYSSDTTSVQEIPTTMKTVFIQNLASLSGGSSVISISPSSGVQEIVLGLSLKPAGSETGLTYAGLALPRGWLYEFIDNISFRYGSSDLYFKDKFNLLLEAQATSSSLGLGDSLFELAGNELSETGDFVGEKLNAVGIICLPHANSASGSEKANPFPSELINAPITITIQLKSQAEVFKIASGYVGTPVIPSQFQDAYLQVRQAEVMDRGMLMSQSQKYLFPTKFWAQANNVSLANTALEQEVVLTGFRAASCTDIYMALVDTADTANPFNFILPSSLVLSYAGNVIHRAKSGAMLQLLDSLYTDVPSYFNNVLLSDAADNGTWAVSDATLSNFIHLPLAQKYEQLTAKVSQMKGLFIANGVMNLQIKTPSAKSTWRLVYIPVYNTGLSFERGQMSYLY
jgi:hypothetical protein